MPQVKGIYPNIDIQSMPHSFIHRQQIGPSFGSVDDSDFALQLVDVCFYILRQLNKNNKNR